MKINFPLLENAILIEKFPILVLEETVVFTKIIEQLYSYEETSELKLFNEKLNPLNPSEILIITDILSFDVNSTEVTHYIMESLKIQINEDLENKNAFNNELQKLSLLLENQLIECTLPLVQQEMNFSNFFKVSKIKVEVSQESIFKKMLDLLLVFKEVYRDKLVIFVNTLSYLKKEEIEEVIHYKEMMKLNVLFIEPREVNAEVPQSILDCDYDLRTKEV